MTTVQPPAGPAAPAAIAIAPLGTPGQRYRMLRLIRGFEELALGLVRSGVITGGIHPYIGQEAVAVGVCAALGPGDRLTSTHRGHGHVLARGAAPHRLLAELAGRVGGLNKGRGGSMHAADLSLGILGANGIVGAGAPIAVGAAWAARQAGDDGVAVSFFGDGALNQGVLLESLNLAAMWRAPVVFVCENNGYATTLPAATAVAGSALGRAAAFGIPAVAVDGMDTEAVRAAAEEAVARARAGGGPGFLECRTYRFEGHHTMERRMKLHYRTAEEVDAWRERDPLPRAAAAIGPAEAGTLDAEVAAELAAAERFALASDHPDPAGAAAYLYADGLRPRAGAVA
ncbi:thiamine pyrophosphate-dependent dehydrogenase E1 component subunit alpha [Kitasatospora sp. CM 4170]|uniref:Thiamine pyrophosphate-dependent dehydrogenase E1 component subunit alpha n=1 Tax=Kitasatospora aburaviensis TaxID=67265 RepID=A0ABW1F0V9_9ACTN|nr:thiamine pyrophosphate-dependent dehydrogenase E1 component subunit alpha [Kitasatospora sp. CM 4170]WNM49440.1 thiamine pyrophosphate-dependent dehydrogenase E1 component subunit alpha [Kitasatospora sp. CM 4170]